MKQDKALPDEDHVPAYSAYEVAHIAAMLFTGCGPEMLENQSYGGVAAAAVALLDACRREVSWTKYLNDSLAPTARDKQTFEIAAAKMAKKYPAGKVPWLHGLFFITRKNSETEATPPFRRWREYEIACKASRKVLDGGAEIQLGREGSERMSDISTFKERGFDPANIPYLRFRYKIWFDKHYLPAVRKAAAKKSVAARKKKQSNR